MSKRNITAFILSVILLLCAVLVYFNARKESQLREEYADTVTRFCFIYNVNANLVLSVIKAESNFDKDAVSRSGAVGLMQILPATGKYISESLGEDFERDKLSEPETNIRYGVWYLSYLSEKFEAQDTVIAAYNAGEGNVRAWLTEYSEDGINLSYIPFSETRAYVERVNKYYAVYRQAYNY